MINSMTGFAAVERETPNGILILELRAVNHRYLELQLKLDENIRSFEPLIREQLTAKLGRGKVECRLSLIQRNNAAKFGSLDHAVLQQLVQMSTMIQQHFPQSQPLSVADVLRWPGILQGESLNHDTLADEICAALAQAIQEMLDSRAREGAKLQAIIGERLADIDTLLEQIQPMLPAQIKAYQTRLIAKLQEVIHNADEERVRQELILFAQRVDVDEELTRLGAHISEVKRILQTGGSAGKRLDFLMQELNREANTLGAKSVSAEVSQTSMSLKLLIEQMREQIQNIE